MAEELQNQSSMTEKRSFWPGILFLAAAAATKMIGSAMAEAVFATADVPGSFLNAGQDLQQAASIEGKTDVVMIILGVIGIIQLIRAAASRRGTSHG